MIETTLNVVLDLCLAGSELIIKSLNNKKRVPLTVTVSDYAVDLIVVFIDIHYIMSDYAGHLIVVFIDI